MCTFNGLFVKIFVKQITGFRLNKSINDPVCFFMLLGSEQEAYINN